MIGRYVYNRQSQKLKGRRQLNPASGVVRVKVMAPLVPRALFIAAQEKLKSRTRESWERGVLISGLRRLLKEKGYINGPAIAACPYLPGPVAVRHQFGALNDPYRQIGYAQEEPDRYRVGRFPQRRGSSSC